MINPLKSTNKPARFKWAFLRLNMINHATHSDKRNSRNPLTREQYLLRCRAKAKRGQDAPAAKLLDIDVISIRSAVRQRESLLKHIRDNLSNKALMSVYGVSEHTITRVVQYQNYGHLA